MGWEINSWAYEGYEYSFSIHPRSYEDCSFSEILEFNHEFNAMMKKTGWKPSEVYGTWVWCSKIANTNWKEDLKTLYDKFQRLDKNNPLKLIPTFINGIFNKD